MPGLWKRSTERMRRTATEWVGQKTVVLFPGPPTPIVTDRCEKNLVRIS